MLSILWTATIGFAQQDPSRKNVKLVTINAPQHPGVGIAAPQVGINKNIIGVQRLEKADGYLSAGNLPERIGTALELFTADLRRLNQWEDADIQNYLRVRKMRNQRLFHPSILKKWKS